MDEEYYLSFAEMELLFMNKEFNKCEPMLTDLINKNPKVSDKEKNCYICLLKKRIIVYYHLHKYDLVLKDMEALQKINVVFNSKDDIFCMYQESVLNLAIESVVNNLRNNSLDENASLIESIIQSLKDFNPKQIFKRLLIGDPKQAAKR